MDVVCDRSTAAAAGRVVDAATLESRRLFRV